jgi:hypothetical protein
MYKWLGSIDSRGTVSLHISSPSTNHIWIWRNKKKMHCANQNAICLAKCPSFQMQNGKIQNDRLGMKYSTLQFLLVPIICISQDEIWPWCQTSFVDNEARKSTMAISIKLIKTKQKQDYLLYLRVAPHEFPVTQMMKLSPFWLRFNGFVISMDGLKVNKILL